MDYLRRDFNLLLPLLIGVPAEATDESDRVLASKCYLYDKLPVKTNPEAHSESRAVFKGETHDGFAIACHMTKLDPGFAPHPPHRHVNEEILFIREGKLEMTVNGNSCVLGPGSLVYVASNDLHGAKSVGDVPAQYFVLELDGQRRA